MESLRPDLPDTPCRAAVVFCCDAGYAPWALAAARSARDRHPGAAFDVLILSGAPLDLPSGLAEGIHPVVMAGPNPYAGGPHASRHGAETYRRLLVPDALAGRYDRVLYLDSDVLCVGDGIDRLLGIDMGGHWVGAVRDNLQWRTPARQVPEFRGAGGFRYFNAGVLLIDLAAWQAAGIGDRALRLFRDEPGRLVRHDQSILNLLAKGQFAELSPVWNWQYTRSSRLFADQAGARILHFIGPRKPWVTGNDLPAALRAPFAAAAQAMGRDAVPGADVWPGTLRGILWRHWRAEPAMRRYLARFDGPFGVARDG